MFIVVVTIDVVIVATLDGFSVCALSIRYYLASCLYCRCSFLSYPCHAIQSSWYGTRPRPKALNQHEFGGYVVITSGLQTISVPFHKLSSDTVITELQPSQQLISHFLSFDADEAGCGSSIPCCLLKERHHEYTECTSSRKRFYGLWYLSRAANRTQQLAQFCEELTWLSLQHRWRSKP